jgi:hypothetical protein
MRCVCAPFFLVLVYIATVECVYTIAIPATPPVPAEVTAGVVDLIAEPIILGQIASGDHIGASRRELKRRMNLISVGADAVRLEAHITDSEVRHHAVVAQHFSRLYAAADAPAWLHPAIIAMNGPLQRSVTALEAAMDGSSASGRNHRIQARNSAVFYRFSGGAGRSEPLSALVKENAGLGAGLNRAHGRPRRVMPALLNVGQVIPSPPFPRTIDELNNLNFASLGTLAILLNDTFGIVAEDDLPNAITKFQDFICGR